MLIYKFSPVLSLFDEGAGSGVASGDAGSNIGSKSDKGLDNVIYGKVDSSVSGAQDASKSSKVVNNDSSVAGNDKTALPDSDKDFDALINGQYKDAFNKRVKGIVDRRVKDKEALARYKTDTEELVGILAAKYNVKSDDLTALTKAIREDDSFFEEAAYNEGLTVEQYKYKLKLEKENERLRAEKESAEKQQAADRRLNQWIADAEKLTELYPGFDLNSETANPKFVKLLQSGIDVKTAFEVVHNQEIVNGAMRVTANEVKKQITDNIRARGLRPLENGSRNQSAAIVKSDPSKFTREDRAEIARRARRGEVIKL